MSRDNDLVICPVCDSLYRVNAADRTRPARCGQCGYRLVLGKPDAIASVVGMALAAAILMAVVVFTPFLQLTAGTFTSRASVLDVVLAFQSDIMVPLSISVLAFIVLLPLARFAFLTYALMPAVFDRAPLPGAAVSLRWAFQLKPWAMAEIFMVGVAVALVKLSGMATLTMGPAFWAFVAVVLLNAYGDALMCRTTLWSAVSKPRP
ncbi:paraquat-inducible protein A [Actibacterium sp. 188UL27-1]|uniref:paraquat-inducible protein A n=1 Tax=Actibacterium sp. 188UL27-1 TaxID=2786961 RepID=UPI00195B5FE1|nr:paraquat-inducible protein A [Actibacterium sp. 188UL27-1]MBM7067259.1 paraquat-inducible protein A [Actibacterium sp. 188UL27-1]